MSVWCFTVHCSQCQEKVWWLQQCTTTPLHPGMSSPSQHLASPRSCSGRISSYSCTGGRSLLPPAWCSLVSWCAGCRLQDITHCCAVVPSFGLSHQHCSSIHCSTAALQPAGHLISCSRPVKEASHSDRGVFKAPQYGDNHCCCTFYTIKWHWLHMRCIFPQHQNWHPGFNCFLWLFMARFFTENR